MAEPPVHQDPGDNTGVRPGPGTPPRTPRWVKVFAMIALVVVVVIVVVLLVGGGSHGPDRHTP